MIAPSARIAAVSGGNRGLGREIVRQLAAQGHRVIMGARDVAAGEAARTGLGSAAAHVEVRPLDVADPASIAAFAESLAADPGALDSLVNNAGVAIDAGVPGADPDFAAMQRTLDVNLLGAWRLTACRSCARPATGGSSASRAAWASSPRWDRGRRPTGSRRRASTS